MFRPLRLRARHVLFAVPIAAALLVLPAAPASAAGPGASLDCTITVTVDVTPPLTLEFRHHGSTSHGLTGTANCTGTVDGQQVTGPGSFLFNSHGAGNCASGSGAGNFVLRIPATGAAKTVPGLYHFSFGSVPPGITVLTGDLAGTLTPISADGDCVNTPLSHGTNRLDVHISS